MWCSKPTHGQTVFLLTNFEVRAFISSYDNLHTICFTEFLFAMVKPSPLRYDNACSTKIMTGKPYILRPKRQIEDFSQKISKLPFGLNCERPVLGLILTRKRFERNF